MTVDERCLGEAIDVNNEKETLYCQLTRNHIGPHFWEVIERNTRTKFIEVRSASWYGPACGIPEFIGTKIRDRPQE